MAVRLTPSKHAAFRDALIHLTLPTLVLATYPTTVMMRFVRESMLEVLDKNYIKTASHAKGVKSEHKSFINMVYAMPYYQ
ncbi:MAG: ABC transporter permease subunit [Rheinheimera sp.]|nr:ABC transporter permease subunit [Rheinheimera sp.]